MIGAGPAAPLAELKDRMEEAEVVQDALRGAAGAPLCGDERLDVARLDAMQQLGAEERREVHPRVRLVVHGRRALAPDPGEMVEVATTGLLDGRTLVR
jgi:hypothetical protein